MHVATVQHFDCRSRAIGARVAPNGENTAIGHRDDSEIGPWRLHLWERLPVEINEKPYLGQEQQLA